MLEFSMVMVLNTTILVILIKHLTKNVAYTFFMEKVKH